MSFRRDRETKLTWRQWVRAHEDELIAIGIPREAWADRFTWWRFLGHAIHPPADTARDVRFRLDDLSPDQQLRLYRLLEAEPSGERVGNVVWMRLHAKFGSEPQ